MAIIVVADHGESFREHGYERRGFKVCEPEIHISVIVSVPSVGHRAIDVPRRVIDGAPTSADLLGLKPPSRFHGFEPEERIAWPVVVDVPEMKGRVRQRR